MGFNTETVNIERPQIDAAMEAGAGNDMYIGVGLRLTLVAAVKTAEFQADANTPS